MARIEGNLSLAEGRTDYFLAFTMEHGLQQAFQLHAASKTRAACKELPGHCPTEAPSWLRAQFRGRTCEDTKHGLHLIQPSELGSSPVQGSVRLAFWRSSFTVTPIWSPGTSGTASLEAVRVAYAVARRPSSAACIFPSIMHREVPA